MSKRSIDNTENFPAIIQHFASGTLIGCSMGKGGRSYASDHAAAEYKNAHAHAAFGGGAGGGVPGRADGAAVCADAARPRRLRGTRRRPAAARGHAARRPWGDLFRRWYAAGRQRDLLDHPRRPAGDGRRRRRTGCAGVERNFRAGLRRYAGQIQPANLQRLPAAPPRG